MRFPLLLLLLAAPATGQALPAAEARLRADVAHLASRELAGRQAGSAGGDSAVAHVARRFASLGLRPAFGSCDPGAACGAFLQTFPWAGATAHNVAAWAAGSEVAGGRFLLVGAHLDHVGRDVTLSRDRDQSLRPRPGADDNASGTAALLELARRFQERPARLPILFVAFDAEESGLVGSGRFAAAPPAPLDSAVLMMNLDMVGRLRRSTLLLDLGGPGPVRRVLQAHLDSAAAPLGVRLRHTAQITGRSDHSTFRQRRVPALALFTGFHVDYHTTRDRPERVNYEGLLTVVDLAEAALRRIAEAPP